jgi:putative ABC transport system permease protein
VRSDAEIRSLSLEIFDRTFRITDVLYLLTVGVAFVGIFGALLALQLEQSRDLAVLRALGFTPLQLGALVQGQTGLMGIMSGLLALPLGTGMAWLLIHVVNRRAFGWQIDMHLTLAPYLQALLLAVAAALLAGIYPAWRMARIPPAAAMREE